MIFESAIKQSAIAAAALFAACAPAAAAIVNPGGVANVPATTSAAQPDLEGAVGNDNLIPFTINDGGGALVASGNLQNRAVTSNNLGVIIFGPRLRDLTLADGAAIVGIRLEGFGMSVLDIAFRTDGDGDIGPDTVSRSVDGDILTFRYDPEITPGLDGLFLSLLSDAFSFALTGVATIFATNANGEQFSVVLQGLAVPTSVVPLPAAAPLFLGGLGLAAVLRRRKRRAA